MLIQQALLVRVRQALCHAHCDRRAGPCARAGGGGTGSSVPRGEGHPEQGVRAESLCSLKDVVAARGQGSLGDSEARARGRRDTPEGQVPAACPPSSTLSLKRRPRPQSEREERRLPKKRKGKGLRERAPGVALPPHARVLPRARPRSRPPARICRLAVCHPASALISVAV